MDRAHSVGVLASKSAVTSSIGMSWVGSGLLGGALKGQLEHNSYTSLAGSLADGRDLTWSRHGSVFPIKSGPCCWPVCRDAWKVSKVTLPKYWSLQVCGIAHVYEISGSGSPAAIANPLASPESASAIASRIIGKSGAPARAFCSPCRMWEASTGDLHCADGPH